MKTKLPIEQATMKIFPLPVALVSCIDNNGNPNIITVTYITGVNEEPPMIGIAIRPEKYSNNLIRQSEEFAVNIPSADLLPKIDFCGSVSGKQINKFKNASLTQIKSSKIKTPLIKECPINIECKLQRVIQFPSHDFFIGRIVALHIDRNILKNGKINFSKLDFVLTTFLDYRVIGRKIGIAFSESNKLQRLKSKIS